GPGRHLHRGARRRTGRHGGLPHRGSRAEPVSAGRVDRHRLPRGAERRLAGEVHHGEPRGGFLEPRHRAGGPLRWLGVASVSVRRSLSLAAVILTALLLQTTVFGDVKLLGARPELMYLITIVFAMIDGPGSGAVAGFAGGMAQDFLMNEPKGITALTLTLLGYVVGLARQYIVSPTPVLPVVLVSGGTFLGVLFNRLVAFLL